MMTHARKGGSVDISPTHSSRPGPGLREAKPGGELGVSPDDAALFYERLEQTGQLEDVTASTDLYHLPPEVTHVRYPDGRIERIGFADSPF